MIIEVICVMFLSYIFYRQGIRQLFKSRIFENNKADHIAYTFFMVTGLLLGSLFCLTIIHMWFPDFSMIGVVIISASVSIVFGEWMYRRNKHIVRRTIIPREGKKTKDHD